MFALCALSLRYCYWSQMNYSESAPIHKYYIWVESVNYHKIGQFGNYKARKVEKVQNIKLLAFITNERTCACALHYRSEITAKWNRKQSTTTHKKKTGIPILILSINCILCVYVSVKVCSCLCSLNFIRF